MFDWFIWDIVLWSDRTIELDSATLDKFVLEDLDTLGQIIGISYTNVLIIQTYILTCFPLSLNVITL